MWQIVAMSCPFLLFRPWHIVKDETMTNENTARLELDDLFTAEELAAKYPRVLSVNTLRWQLRNRRSNGLDRACVSLRRKLLISKSRFEEWLAAQVESEQPSPPAKPAASARSPYTLA